jgi:hypothetical protein
MHDDLRSLWLAHDGPAPRTDLAAAYWGVGAAERLARGAAAGLAEARLRACLGALARLGRAKSVSGAMLRLFEAASFYRRESLAARA